MLFVLAPLLTSPAMACRCAERELADYFAQADRVLMAMVESTALDDVETGTLTVRYRSMGTPWKGTPGANDLQQFLTSSSSAGCGLLPEIGEIWVLFLSDSETSLANSCDGSRRFADPAVRSMAEDDKPLFEDVTRRHLAAQLNALAGLDRLRALHEADGSKLTGLLDIKTLSHGAPVYLYKEPEPDSQPLASIEAIEALQHREASYEYKAAEVYNRRNGFFQLRLADGRWVWMGEEHAGTWFPYPELVVNRLNYMTENWPGFLWPDIGAGLPIRLGRATEQRPARVTRVAELAGSTWLHVEILTTDGCDGQTPQVTAAGWTPAWGENDAPVAWFYSRGC